jgi:F-type H+-transporting ATPase subunit gamma
MANTRELKTRIRSVKNTKQITRAMQMVAASKMRKAQDADKESAPYATTARDILNYLAGQSETTIHPLFATREVKKRLIVVIAADKGLAGAYNSNILKEYVRVLKENDSKKIADQTIAIGRRAGQFVGRLKGAELAGVYDDLSDRPAGNELKAIVDTIIQKFTIGEVDQVDIVFTKFVNSIIQTPQRLQLLPIGADIASEDVKTQFSAAKFEPSPEAVLEAVAHRLLSAEIYQSILDSKASEWSMRMIAMKNATDNASDVIDDLTLEMNKARQGAITQELAEISGGVEAMNN